MPFQNQGQKFLGNFFQLGTAMNNDIRLSEVREFKDDVLII